MTTGELITSIIGGLGLIAGIIGFFMARSASKKADEASVTAAQAQVDLATATTAIASILARTNPEPVPHVKWKLQATGKADQFAVVNVGNTEARNVTVQATDNSMAGLVHAPDHPTVEPGDHYSFMLMARLAYSLKELDVVWNDDSVAHGQTKTLRVP